MAAVVVEVKVRAAAVGAAVGGDTAAAGVTVSKARVEQG